MNGVLQDMIANKEMYKVSEENNGTVTVITRPSEISYSLIEKLNKADVDNVTLNAISDFEYNNMITSLYNACSCVDCNNKNKCSQFRAIPNGNINADVMFVNKMPTKYEACNFLSHCDRGSMFLNVILGKLNLSRKNVYFTDMIKCNYADIEEETLKKCINNNLTKEINYIKPKLIIFNGQIALKILRDYGYVKGLPESITYGTIYDVSVTNFNINTKVMSIYELDKVLQKPKDEYMSCKQVLWRHLYSSLEEVGVIKSK